MKKIVSAAIAFVMASVLTVSAFAASPTTVVTDNTSSNTAIGVVKTDSTMNVAVKEASATEANEAMAKEQGVTVLGSFDIVVTNDKGEEVHANAGTVVVPYDCGAENAGKWAVLYETSQGKTVVAACVKIAADGSVTFSIDTFSTYTVGVSDKEIEVAKAPQTSQNAMPVAVAALAALALTGCVAAVKRRDNI